MLYILLLASLYLLPYKCLHSSTLIKFLSLYFLAPVWSHDSVWSVEQGGGARGLQGTPKVILLVTQPNCLSELADIVVESQENLLAFIVMYPPGTCV